MCWYGREDNMKIADKDTTVYKILRKTERNGKMHYQGPLFCKSYDMKYKYHTNLGLVPKNTPFLEINTGFHCYSKNVIVTADKAHKLLTAYSKDKKMLLRLYYDPSVSAALIKCTIPKGTTYYENYSGEIVTDTIIIEEELKIPNDIIIDITEE